jgi:Leucine-rich repeat (LRR) protein
MDIQPGSPLHFSNLPEEIQRQIIVLCNPAVTVKICRAWKVVALSDATTLFWLEKQAGEFGLTSVINKAREKTTEADADKSTFILSNLFLRAWPSSSRSNFHLDFIFAQMLLTWEKANNLCILCEAIGSQMPTLYEYINTPEFTWSSFVKKGTLLKVFLANHPDECAKVEQLMLINKNLTLIPEELELFPNLISLHLSSNKITELPESFGSSWSNLEAINLSGNKIEFLPKDFGKHWINIKKIDISINSIASLPSEFGTHWKSLTSLTLQNNNLKQVSPDFGNSWGKLTFLYVNKNPLETDIKSDKNKWPGLVFLS